MYECFVGIYLRRGIRAPWTGITDGCELPHGCWNLNPGPLKEPPFAHWAISPASRGQLYTLSSFFIHKAKLVFGGYLVSLSSTLLQISSGSSTQTFVNFVYLHCKNKISKEDQGPRDSDLCSTMRTSEWSLETQTWQGVDISRELRWLLSSEPVQLRKSLWSRISLLGSTAKQVHNILPLPTDFYHVRKVKGHTRCQHRDFTGSVSGILMSRWSHSSAMQRFSEIR